MLLATDARRVEDIDEALLTGAETDDARLRLTGAEGLLAIDARRVVETDDTLLTGAEMDDARLRLMGAEGLLATDAREIDEALLAGAEIDDARLRLTEAEGLLAADAREIDEALLAGAETDDARLRLTGAEGLLAADARRVVEMDDALLTGTEIEEGRALLGADDRWAEDTDEAWLRLAELASDARLLDAEDRRAEETEDGLAETEEGMIELAREDDTLDRRVETTDAEELATGEDIPRVDERSTELGELAIERDELIAIGVLDGTDELAGRETLEEIAETLETARFFRAGLIKGETGTNGSDELRSTASWFCGKTFVLPRATSPFAKTLLAEAWATKEMAKRPHKDLKDMMRRNQITTDI